MNKFNFCSQLISAGFELHEYYKGLFRRGFNPNDNFFGTSPYHPDVLLVKGDKTARISLNGSLAPEPIKIRYKDGGSNVLSPWEYSLQHHNILGKHTITKDQYDLFVGGGMRFILLADKEKIVFVSFTGESPDRDLIDKFI